MTSFVTESASIASRLIGRFADWLGRFHGSADIRALSASELEAIARDLRIPRAEFDTLVAHSRQGAKELPQLLQELGIDEATIVRKSRARLDISMRTLRSEVPVQP